MMKRKRRSTRGYPVALLVGFEEDHAVLWQIFSHAAKLIRTFELREKRVDIKALYSFHESVFDTLRPLFNEGVRSIVIAAPMKTTYASDFLDHVRKHHVYLTQPERLERATFGELVGSVDQPYEVAELVKTKEFRKLIKDMTSQETDQVINALEKNLHSNNIMVLFSLKEIEDTIYDRKRPSEFRTEYLMLTDKYLADNENKNRLNRLLQISKNRSVKTRIINAETPGGKRISQFGGIIFFTLPQRATLRPQK